MNKNLGIVVGVVVLLLLIAGGGYYYLYMSKSLQTSYDTKAPTKSSGVFSSIQEALLNHLSLACDYTVGSMHTVAFIKNGMIRADITDSQNPSQSGSVIMKDKKIYYWNGKAGMMMTMPDITGVMPTVSPEAGSSGQETIQNLEQYKHYCKTASVADSEFDIPADVKFSDETQMMQKMPTTAMPSGVPTQYQQYMQQYHITP